MEARDVGYRNMDSQGFDILTSVMSHIAHDFSNLLTPLLTYPSLVRNDLPEECLGHELLNVIERTSRDMAHITGQLQLLAGHDEGSREELDLNSVVREVCIGLQSEAVSPDVQVDMKLADGLPLTHASVDDILAAAIHVGRNAIEAVEPSGRVVLNTACADLPAGFDVSGSPSPAGTFVCFSVCDDGTGIPEELQESMFEPFMTTKNMRAKRGSGLGLTIVHKIMREHRGRIGVVSKLGEGTTVTLYLRAWTAGDPPAA